MPAVAEIAGIVQRRVDPRPLAIARIIAGVNAAILSLEAAAKLWLILEPGILHLPYIPGIPVMSQEMLTPFIALWFTLAIAFTIGWKTRVSGVILATLMGYAFLVDQQAYSNHVYLLTLLLILLTLANGGAALSLDARHSNADQRAPQWPVLLLKIQLSIVYFYAAVSKINPEYLSGAMIDATLRVGGPLAIPAAWHGTPVMAAIAIASILTELFLAVAFWSSRWRSLALVVGIGFHISILLTMHTHEFLGLLGFGLCMCVVYPLFFKMDRLWH